MFDKRVDDAEAREEERAEYIRQSIEDHKKELMVGFSNLSNFEIAQVIQEVYDTSFDDFMEDCLRDEGVIDYFCLGNVHEYRNAISSLLEYIDFTKFIESGL